MTRSSRCSPSSLPPGLSGLLLAGILVAAMSTLSSSLSARSSSTVTDVKGKLRRTPIDGQQGLRIGRWAPIGWGLAFIAPATGFRSEEGNIVVLALGVASATYGWLLGAFVFGIVNKSARAANANIALMVAVAVNSFLFVMKKYVVGDVWVAWQWYPLRSAKYRLRPRLNGASGSRRRRPRHASDEHNRSR